MKKKLMLTLVILFFPFASHVQANTTVEKSFNDEEILEPLLEQEELTQPTPRSRSIKQSIILPEQEVKAIQKIQQDYHAMKNSQTNENKFIEAPVLSNGTYTLGKFNPTVQNSVTEQVNFYRSLGNLKSIPLKQENIDLAQHAAMGMAAIKKQTHYLGNNPKPADMPDDFWQTAIKGAQSSNIHSSAKEKSLNSHIDGYIVDYGRVNQEVGHRAGILGLQAESIGTGYAQVNDDFPTDFSFYTATNVTSNYRDIPNKYDNDFITQWPVENHFPLQLYNTDNPYTSDYYKNNKNPDLKARYEKNMRWSIHFNEKSYFIEDNAQVELVNHDTGEKTIMGNDTNGGELTISNKTPGYYSTGGYATLAFRPNHDFTISPNTLYTVNVTGILKNDKPFIYSYSTRIVDMDATYEAGVLPVQKVAIVPDQLTLGKGDQAQLSTIFTPSNATNKEVEWSSSDASIAKVDQKGVVTALKPGTTTILVKTADGGYTAKSTITVDNRHIPVKSLEVTDKRANIITQIGKPLPIEVKVLPEAASNPKLIWESSNPEVAMVNEQGILETKSFGRTQITVYTEENHDLRHTFTVIADDHGESVEEATPLTLGKPTEGRYDVAIEEGLAAISWSGDYDYFHFKAPKAGAYTFTGFATQPNGFQDGLDIASYSTSKPYWSRSNYLSDFHTVYLAENEDLWIYVSGQKLMDPENPKNHIVYTKVGTTYNVMVDLNENYQFGTLAILDAANQTLTTEQKIAVGETMTLQGKIENSNIVNPFYYTINWESSNRNIAEIDYKTGVITAKAPGKVTITAKNSYGIFTLSKIKQSITFNVE